MGRRAGRVAPWDEAQLHGGCFDQHAMLSFLEDALKKGELRDREGGSRCASARSSTK
jgi:hypothetical protein